MTVQRINTQVKGYTIRERINYDSWNEGNVIISRNGKQYRHEYYPTAQDRQNKTAQQIGNDMLADFFQTAYIGSLGLDKYIDIYQGTKDEYKHYQKANKALHRLDPDGAEMALSSVKETLNV